MSKQELPDEVETEQEFDHGYYSVKRADRDILDDLVESHNQLVRYLKERELTEVES